MSKKRLTAEQDEHIRSLESKGDALFEKCTFDSCLDAQAAYLDAINTLQKYAQDDTIDDKHCVLKTDSISYKNWYFSLRDKLDKVATALLDPKLARK